MDTPPASLVPENIDVWILAGQSNMEGRGLLREGLQPDERVWSFSPSGAWEVASEPLHRPWESFTENHPTLLRAETVEADGKSNAEMARICQQTQVTGAGLGLAFGIEVADQTGRPVGLIPCAHGGTSLAEWSPDKRTTADLYGALLERVRMAGGKLGGILWYQGESDANPTWAVTYTERVSHWIETLRQDLELPSLPVFIVQLGRVIDILEPIATKVRSQTGWQIIREAIRQLPGHVSNCHVTSAIDLGLHDAIHLDTYSLIRLGRRLARLAGGAKTPTVSSIVRDREEEQIRGGHGVIQICCNTHGSVWKKIHPLSGFSILDPNGNPHPTTVLIQAEVAVNDPTALRLVTNQLPDDTVRVAYGWGLNPFCNVVTEEDAPLCAFSLQPVA